MTYYLRTVSMFVFLASGLLPAYANDDNRPNNWQQSFPLSILKKGDDTTVGRPDLNRPLSYRDTEASNDQIDPLNKTASIVFGNQITTVGDAAKMILRPVGYELLASGPNTSRLLDELLESPLPDNQRGFTHLRVREMLRALAGVGHVVVFDHVHRKATFDPRPRYLKLGQASQPDTPLSILTQELSAVEPVSSEWREVSSEQSGESFSDRLSRVLVEDEPNKSAVVVQSVLRVTIDSSVEVRGDSESQRLRPSTEMSLRRIAGDFNAEDHSVVIQNCSGEVSPSSLNRHASLIGSSLVRLGVESRYQSDGPCDVDRDNMASDGEIVHVIALTMNSTEG